MHLDGSLGGGGEVHGEARLAEVLEAGGGVAEHAQGGGAPARARDQVKQEQEVVPCQQCVFESWRLTLAKF